MYLGTDVLGSVRSATVDIGLIEDRYEYDAFGTPYQGDFSSGMNLGYTGKPYDPATGLYNYGFRDYAPQVARFTTVDPIRDGNNWFAFVNNDPINWVDPWGLNASEPRSRGVSREEQLLHQQAGGGSTDYNKITINAGMPTYQDVRHIASTHGINTSKIADYQIQDYLEGKDALSLPNGNIYMKDNLMTPPEKLALVVHEIEHQSQYQNGNPLSVFSQLFEEAQIYGVAAYSTPGLLEYQAQQVQNRAKAILDDL
jgi:RHS repeat-associated protein